MARPLTHDDQVEVRALWQRVRDTVLAIALERAQLQAAGAAALGEDGDEGGGGGDSAVGDEVRDRTLRALRRGTVRTERPVFALSSSSLSTSSAPASSAAEGEEGLTRSLPRPATTAAAGATAMAAADDGRQLIGPREPHHRRELARIEPFLIGTAGGSSLWLAYTRVRGHVLSRTLSAQFVIGALRKALLAALCELDK